MNNNLRKLRKSNNLSLEKLSTELNTKQNFKISSDMIDKYEQGYSDAKLSTWEQFADYFNVPVSYMQGTSQIKDKNILQHPKEFFKYCQKEYGTHTSENGNQFILIDEQEIPVLFTEQHIINANNLFKAFGKNEMNNSEEDLQRYEDIFVNMKNKNILAISDMYFFMSNIFYAYLESENGDKKAKNATKKIEKIINKYLDIDDAF